MNSKLVGAGFSFEPVPALGPRSYSAKNAVELLEDRGLADATVVEGELHKWPIAKIEALAADLYDFLSQQRESWTKDDPASASPFNYLASASLRADSGCSRPECRSEKLGVLARYAAMYADHVFLPVALRRPTAGAQPGRLRDEVSKTAFSVLELRPLVEAGIIRPILPHMHYCSDCAKREFERFGAGMAAARTQAKRHLDEFKFTCMQVLDSPKIVAVEMDGPADYLEHGSMIRVYQRPPEWFPRTLKANARYRVPKATVRRAGLVEQIFAGIAADVYFHQGFQDRFDAGYLTDLPGEAEFLRTLSVKDELAIRTAQVCSQLAHDIPLLTDLPVRAVIEIRNESRESFELYRSTLGTLINEYVGKHRSTTAREARQIYKDVLEPTLAQLRVEAKRQRKIWRRKSSLAAGFALGVVSLCATGVLQSSQLLALLGGATVKGLLDQLAETPETQPVTSSNLYFLLRLEQETEKRFSNSR